MVMYVSSIANLFKSYSANANEKINDRLFASVLAK
jgi:hypothetical protein